MASKNLSTRTSIKTYEGGAARRITPEQQLRRSVMSCLLWEREFYEEGGQISKRILDLIPQVDPQVVSSIAIEARKDMNLRHVPLLIIIGMLKVPSHRKYVAKTIVNVISRPDELNELVALYFDGKKKPLANQLKKGLAEAFTKFNAYQLAKWNRPKDIKLRDVLFMCHPKPKDEEQAKTFKQLAEDTLPVPDTWEVALSSGGNKKDHWTRLLKENKLGAMALLRNLRNMIDADVPKQLIKEAIVKINDSKVLPFRYIAAARYAPPLEGSIEVAMMNSLAQQQRLPGKTVLLIDVSGSMDWELSEKSDISRMDAGCGLAMLLREICEDVDIYTFSTKLVQVPPRRGFALRDAIVASQEHSSTYLGAAVRAIYAKRGSHHEIGTNRMDYRSIGKSFSGQGLSPDRLVVITDEQSADSVSNPLKGKGYMINVASAKSGVGYGPWVHVDGFSEAVVRWIQELENNNY